MANKLTNLKISSPKTNPNIGLVYKMSVFYLDINNSLVIPNFIIMLRDINPLCSRHVLLLPTKCKYLIPDLIDSFKKYMSKTDTKVELLLTIEDYNEDIIKDVIYERYKRSKNIFYCKCSELNFNSTKDCLNNKGIDDGNVIYYLNKTMKKPPYYYQTKLTNMLQDYLIKKRLDNIEE